MAADTAPWTKWFHEDFLQGVMLANLTSEEIGVYTVVLSLIAARGGPIEADSRWINGYAGCATVRKCTAVIDRLVEKRKLERRGKLLGNAKMIRTVEARDTKSDQARKAALARWHGHNEPDLFDDQNRGDKRGDNGADNHRDKSEIKSGINSQERQKTANEAHADASPPVRARDSETQKNNLTHPILSTVAPEIETGSGAGPVAPLNQRDLVALHAAVCEAAGYRAVNPTTIAASMDQVKEWRDQGHDFETVVLPAIRAVVAQSKPDDRTRTLGRFRHAVAREAAKAHEAKGKGRTHKPTATPLLEPPDEDAQFRPMRETLLEQLGPLTFASLLNPVRFEDIGETAGKHPVRVKGPDVNRLLDSERAGPAVRRAALAMGFTDVWKG